jgi:hypothetical protein
MEGSMEYKKHNATIPIYPNFLTVIFHCNNDIRRWGKGFVVELGQRYPAAKDKYLTTNLKLGDCQLVKISDKLYVANLIGQHGIWKDKDGNPPIRYESLEEALNNLVNMINLYFDSFLSIKRQIVLQCPRLGAGLAGGEWSRIEQILHLAIEKNPNRTFEYRLFVCDLL